MVYSKDRTNTDTKHDKKHVFPHSEFTLLRVVHKSRHGCRYRCGCSGTRTVSLCFKTHTLSKLVPWLHTYARVIA